MPPVCDAILKRRAIKQYTKEAIPVEAIEYLRKVAVAIPTGHNTRHTEFAFVTNPRIIKTISQAKGEKAEYLQHAKLLIIVMGIQNDGVTSIATDMSIAAAMIQLACSDFGLACSWEQFYGRKNVYGEDSERIVLDVLRLLNSPNRRVLCALGIGYPAVQMPPANMHENGRIYLIE